MAKAIIAVVGTKRSGKTTAVEALVKGLTKRGYKVATAKHVPETNFTIDTEGKDTWKHAKAGARIVIAVAPNEVAIIKKDDTSKYKLNDIVKNCEKEVDIIILEGFRNLVKNDFSVPKIVTVKTIGEAKKATKCFKPILAFAGSVSTERLGLGVPYVDVLKQPEKLADIVDKKLLSY